MVPIARRNLLADKVKLIVAVGGVTLAIVLMIVINSLYQGVRRDTATFIHAMPGDVWVMQEGTTDLVFSNSALPASDADKYRKVTGVANVAALHGRLMSFGVGNDTVRTYVMSLDYLGGPIQGKGSDLVPPDGKIIVDKTFAKQAGLKLGDPLPVSGTFLTVSDIRDVGNVLVTQFSFVSANDFNSLVGLPNTVNYFLITLKPGVDRSTVEANIGRMAKNTRVLETNDWAKLASDKGTGDFLPIIRVILSISFIVGLAVLSLVIYSATIERAREYAIMKVIGASPLGLYRIVLSQSMFIAATGFIAGVALAFLFNAIAGDVVPQFITYIRPIDIALVLLATALMTVVASVLPLARIARVEPASVFRA